MQSREKTCCFTGHRPEKVSLPCNEVKQLLQNAINEAINDGYDTFISGMARGIDIMAAEIVLNIKMQNSNIKLVCAVPFENFEKSWDEQDKAVYHGIIEKSDEVVYVCKHYFKSAFQMRNCYMADRSSRVIAFCTEQKGGTRNTVKYAQKNGLKVVNVV